MESIICDAIRGKRIIEFSYKQRVRRVEPHLLGYDSDGDLTLSAWQLSGGSGVEFRDFHVNEMKSLTVADDTFDGPRPGYNPNDRTITRIICAL